MDRRFELIRVWVSIVLLLIAAVVIVASISSGAGAQENHQRHHSDYRDWKNQNDQGCCNNQDCGELAEANERTKNGKLEVRIEGEWCPVLPHHYLKKGNAPNWSTSHVCVQVPYYADDYGTQVPNPTPVCNRLLCYQPKPLF